MIVTLTANPSLDRTITLEAPLRPGQVQTATDVREDAGGKGINVSRVVAAAGVPTIAVLPLDDADPFAAALAGTDGVTGVTATRTGGWRVDTAADLRPEIARRVVGAGGQLRTMSIRRTTLDEVYVRFFEEEARHAEAA